MLGSRDGSAVVWREGGGEGGALARCLFGLSNWTRVNKREALGSTGAA